MYLNNKQISKHPDSCRCWDVLIQVVEVEIGVLVVGHEHVIVPVLQTHVCFHYEVVGHEKGEEAVNAQSSEFEELDPF